MLQILLCKNFPSRVEFFTLSAYTVADYHLTAFMEVTHLIQIVIVLLASMVGLAGLANRLAIPVPLILVPAGALLGFMPWFPKIEINPDLILLVFLPPLVFAGGAFSSWQTFRKNLRPIILLSVGLALFTMLLVAAAAHYFISGMSWPVAFVLGAILAPTDTVAAATIARRLSLPHRLTTILEGEGLFNDATALTAFRFATAAVVAGSFSFNDAVRTFFAVVIGEVAYGLLLGWLMLKIRPRDPILAITVVLLTPFLAYLPPQQLGGSGVLATAVAGLYMGRNIATATPGIRLAGLPFWRVIIFILNNILFLVTGMQLNRIIERAGGVSSSALFYDGVLISLVVILVRIIWVYPHALLPRILGNRRRDREPLAPFRHIFIFSWTGMRGAVSLAAAFGIPVVTAVGTPFPGRDLIIFITFCVILSTLVVQGITLPALIPWLGIDLDGRRERKGAHHEETRARIQSAQAALAEVDTWTKEGDSSAEMARHLRRHYEKLLRNLDRHQDEKRDDEPDDLLKWETDLQRRALAAERSKIIELHGNGSISDDVLRIIELDLDLQEMRLDQDSHTA
jgi:Na+/H+ antiporter